MKSLIGAAHVAIPAILLSMSSQAAFYQLSGDMDVFQATTNPSNVGNGSGSIAGDYDDVSNILNYVITWSDLTSEVTNMHFHLGPPGTAGGVELGVPGPWSSPQNGSGISISDAQEANLLAGNWYLNVHTSEFGGGEIRGQVAASAIPVPAAIWLFGSACIAMGLMRGKQ